MPNNDNMIICEKCDFKCFKLSNYEKHILTRKHISAYANLPPKIEILNYSCKCGKEYKFRQSLYTHKKTCQAINHDSVNSEIQDPSNNGVIQVLLKENSDFKSMLIEMMKSNTDLQKQMVDLCQKIQPTQPTQPSTINNNINTDNSSKTFNLQVFLNEKCKDAMNLDDFANSIQLKLSDLIRVGEEGYIPGMSKVIIEWLKKLEECQRPIHCSDEKREVIQVKMADKWEKEAITSEKLMNAVRIVEKKQFDMITTFRDTYPECMNSESHHNDMLIKLFQNLSNSREPEFIKVMKKVAKSVVINKEENS